MVNEQIVYECIEDAGMNWAEFEGKQSYLISAFGKFEARLESKLREENQPIVDELIKLREEYKAMVDQQRRERRVMDINQKNNDERRAVTVGQIMDIYEDRLDREISELTVMIRKGYHNRHQAEKYLQDQIGTTLTLMDNLLSAAGLPKLLGVFELNEPTNESEESDE